MMKKESMVGGNRRKKETKSKNKRTTKPLALPLTLFLILVCIVIVTAMPAPTLSFIASTPANNANAYQQNSPVSSISILNPQSYPSVGENWTVRFNTTGKANLTITAVNGTTWSNENEDTDLQFREIKCGNKTRDYEWINNSVFIENYECDETGYEVSKVLTLGKHTLEFRFGDDVTYTQEQDFTGGVLAINTHKSIYLPNEAAFIGIAVLDNEGHMVCDADVTLTITDPGNNETVLSTSNGLINVSPQCCVYGVTNLPDFYTNYTVGGAGTYVMNLTVTAVTADGTKSITDVFTVQNSVDFDVARDGPTRIYPPVPYVMNFTIKANKDYDGLIREYVPASFVITPQDGLTVTTVGDTKILTWTKNLVKGETYNIYYEFDAPDISPYLFTLGALEIGNWKEARQWMIAADASYIFTMRPTSDVSVAWTPKSAGSNYVQIDEVVHDDDASYVYNSASATIDKYGLTDHTTETGTISQVKMYIWCYQTGNEYLDIGIVSGRTTDTVRITPAGSWSEYTNTWENNPGNSDLPWVWANIDALEAYIKSKNNGGWSGTQYVTQIYYEVTYYTPTLWESYNDPNHDNLDDYFSDDEHTVYMHGTGFLPSHTYKVAYYDAATKNNHIETDTVNSDADENLNSDCVFTSYPSSTAGTTWHAIVCDGTQDPPSTYDSGWAGIILDKRFTVEESAILEFPTVIAAIAVCLLCTVAYVVTRRKAGKR